MRILLIHQYFLEKEDAGGSRFNEMTKVWEAQGNQVTVLAGMIHANASEKYPKYKGKWFFKENHSDHIEVIRCHVSESYNKSFLGRLWGYFSFVLFSIWAGIFKTKGKYDLVLVTSPPLFVGITGYILSRWKRIPLVFEVRDLWPESAIDTGVLTNGLLIRLSFAFEKFIYKKSKLINVLTPAFRDKLIQEKGVAAEKVIFIPNAADFSLSDSLWNSFDRNAFRQAHSWDNKFVITYVGAHGVANHLIQVLDTAALIQDLPVLLVMIGDGMEKKTLKQTAASRGLKNVVFLDPIPKKEVFKYIIASDMGASVLKKVDTFKTIYSNKTFDYMSCKKPILMAIDGVSRELLEKAEAGSFVEPENPEDFARVIREYYRNPAKAVKEGENGYLYAKKYFDRNYLAGEYAVALKQCLEK